MSELVGGIYEALCNIQKEFPAITKDRINPGLKYKFRGVDDALIALNPLLAKHGVFLTFEDTRVHVNETGATQSGTKQYRAILHAKVRWNHIDGSYVTCSAVGEGVDTGDKTVTKAWSGAMKYMIWYMFAVPTEEKKDVEAFTDG